MTILILFSVDSLVKLHRKTKSIDVYLDDRGDLATTRIVWGEVRDNLERGEDDSPVYIDTLLMNTALEALTREAFCNTLTTDVVNSLVTLRVRMSTKRPRPFDEAAI